MAPIRNELIESIAKRGFFLAPDVLVANEMSKLLRSFVSYSESRHAVKRGGKTYALRSVLNEIPEVLEVAKCDAVFTLVKAVLGDACVPTKAILFDKTEGVNWNLQWHQDLTISVKEKVEVQGFEPWSQKAGIPHVQPPASVMESILAARIHLDDCSEDNGALHVIPGSHMEGILSDEDKQRWKDQKSEICAARKGDVLLMRPLLLHSSKKAANPSHRRVLHIEYSTEKLPGGLKWGG